MYQGEIENERPKGKGFLRMTDQSYFEGSFDGKSMVEGDFVHFSGMKFTGKFNNDRFY